MKSGRRKVGRSRLRKRRAVPRRRSASNSRRRRDAALAALPRWNPDPEEVQRSVIKLVLSLVEFIRQLMERQAIRRFEARTLTPEEIEALGLALMRLEETVKEIAARFGLQPEDLNLDLGPLGTLR